MKPQGTRHVQMCTCQPCRPRRFHVRLRTRMWQVSKGGPAHTSLMSCGGGQTGGIKVARVGQVGMGMGHLSYWWDQGSKYDREWLLAHRAARALKQAWPSSLHEGQETRNKLCSRPCPPACLALRVPLVSLQQVPSLVYPWHTRAACTCWPKPEKPTQGTRTTRRNKTL
jgi:hypothetical protein